MSEEKASGITAPERGSHSHPLEHEEHARSPHHDVGPSITSGDDAQQIKERVRELARLDVKARPPALRTVARQLAIAPRTLQRRLREGGTTFRSLLNDVRLELATEELANRATVTKAAEAAGFSEASCFHRAFKRWTGQTPRRFVSKIDSPGLEPSRPTDQS
jgi:AraC-like DNA-binding protein